MNALLDRVVTVLLGLMTAQLECIDVFTEHNYANPDTAVVKLSIL